MLVFPPRPTLVLRERLPSQSRRIGRDLNINEIAQRRSTSSLLDRGTVVIKNDIASPMLSADNIGASWLGPTERLKMNTRDGLGGSEQRLVEANIMPGERVWELGWASLE